MTAAAELGDNNAAVDGLDDAEDVDAAEGDDADDDGVNNATSLAGVLVDAQAVIIATKGTTNAMLMRRRRGVSTRLAPGRGQFDG